MTSEPSKTTRGKAPGKEPPLVIIARGEKITHFTFRPWMALAGGIAFLAISAASLGATAYLMLRDDARPGDNTQFYEERIAKLNAEVDRLTRRQALDRQAMEDKVAELMQRQQTLSARDGKLAPLLGRAMQPMPDRPSEPAPEQESRAIPDDAIGDGGFPGIDPIVTGPVPAKGLERRADLRPAGGLSGESTRETSDKIVAAVDEALHRIETEQNGRLRDLADAAARKADTIIGTLNAAGLRLELGDRARSAMGGPLVPVWSTETAPSQFDMQLRTLDSALDRLDTIRAKLGALPLTNPAPGMPVTSLFGFRRDPLFGTAAFHSGIDFRAAYGQRVTATAAGTVTKAGRFGGYGNMVEIDHGNGFTTRFAHLSRVLVHIGQTVAPGAPVGEAGSTGRSTGSHLHYEVRENGRAVNPVNFLKAGRQIEALL